MCVFFKMIVCKGYDDYQLNRQTVVTILMFLQIMNKMN